MAAKIDEKLLHGSWLHAHEEDAPGRPTFRPEAYPLPPARGRYGYEFMSGGRLRKREPGATDRRSFVEGTWSLDEEGRIAVRIPGRPDEVFEVEAIAPVRLVLKR